MWAVIAILVGLALGWAYCAYHLASLWLAALLSVGPDSGPLALAALLAPLVCLALARRIARRAEAHPRMGWALGLGWAVPASYGAVWGLLSAEALLCS